MLKRLLPPGDPIAVEELVADLAAREGVTWPARGPAAGPAGRPYLALNMVSTADGRASIGGRSGPIGNRADRELFHGLRSVTDAVIAGAGTVRAERYGRIVPDEAHRRARVARGLSAEPLACIVSGRLELPSDLPLLTDPAARVAILTPSAASLTKHAAHVDYIRPSHEGLLDLPAALAELHERFAVRTLLCEGGPHLNAQLLAAGLVDELFLCLSPLLAGGDPVAGEALRILAGLDLDPPIELRLVGALENESHLFLRYAVG